ncbi:MAG: ATP phosphoribosyltransferase regulatory subunit [Betaproteobacteria bacterium]|nr:ATP phosphoribosyltransferase regulatory subunit [Betaproteobacteria bacterium]
MHNWLLPEYIEDVLPRDAARIESMRAAVLELFRVHGYELVMPPLMEYMESLLSGTGRDMELQTFKVVDQLSGRLMGVRADITPQVARIDAHLLNRQGVTRLCYAGAVMHALPAGSSSARECLQVGAEVYGDASVESDIEIQRLMLKALAVAGQAPVQLDLGHVAIFRALIERGGLAPELEADLFQALQGKDLPSLRTMTRGLDAATRRALEGLPGLYGGREVLTEARRCLPAYPEIGRALDDLEAIQARLDSEVAGVGFDLADLRGYHYHTGVVFAAYASAFPQAIALGGRYDQIGRAFGRARPATGFSMDLRQIAPMTPFAERPPGVLVPEAAKAHPERARLDEAVDRLRARGEVVVMELPGHREARGELNCDRQLRFRDGEWVLDGLDPGA